MKAETIAIVGGGPGGLTLARLLQQRGFDVKVYERDVNRSARVQGATLNLNEDSGLLAIRKAGLEEAFFRAFRPGAEALAVMSHDGKLLVAELPHKDLVETRPEIDRGPLREVLLGSLAEGTVVWDRQFSSLARAANGIDLHFKNGATARADLVIAADGASSKVRPYVTPLKPIYSGVTAIEGVVYDVSKTLPRIHELLNGGKICALGTDHSLFVALKGDDSAAFYGGFNCDERWAKSGGVDFTDQAQVVAWFQKEFSGWDAMWIELFAKATPPFLPRPQFYAPLDQTWEAQADLTLLGDAAHVMPPYAGEGVNMAMLDAIDLAEALEREGIGKAAIASYEAKMRARASASAKETLEFTAIFHSPKATAFFVDFFGTPHRLEEGSRILDAG